MFITLQNLPKLIPQQPYYYFKYSSIVSLKMKCTPQSMTVGCWVRVKKLLHGCATPTKGIQSKLCKNDTRGCARRFWSSISVLLPTITANSLIVHLNHACCFSLFSNQSSNRRPARLE